MTILTSAYQTSHNQARQPEMEKAKKEIATALTTKALKPSTHSEFLYLIDNEFDELANIPSFGSPIVMINRMTSTQIVVVDVRPFMYASKPGAMREMPKVRNIPEYTLEVLRGLYTVRWMHGQASDMRVATPIPMIAFSRWIADAGTRQMTLDANSQRKLRILSCWYYLSMFTNQEKFSAVDSTRYKAMIAREGRFDTKDVLDVLDSDDVIPSLEKFCERARAVIESVRMNNFIPGVLSTALSNTLFGVNRRHYLTSALEFPPDWLAIVALCARDTYYKKTLVYSLIETAAGRTGMGPLAKTLTYEAGSPDL